MIDPGQAAAAEFLQDMILVIAVGIAIGGLIAAVLLQLAGIKARR